MFFFASLKVKRGLQKTYFLPLISVFTLVNSELRNFSSDKVTPKLLIINNLRCHLYENKLQIYGAYFHINNFLVFGL